MFQDHKNLILLLKTIYKTNDAYFLHVFAPTDPQISYFLRENCSDGSRFLDPCPVPPYVLNPSAPPGENGKLTVRINAK